jgi:Tfp pilus assembly protein PilN
MGSYALLGGLALLVVLVAAYALANRSVHQRQHELAAVRDQAAGTEATVQRLQAYTAFGTLSRNRVQTVTQLAQSRFDWAHALHEVARTVPSDVWLTSLRGTVSNDTPVDGSGDTASMRGQVDVPAIELVGCTTTQTRVATMISAMRRIDGVQRVSLSSSSKAESAGGGPSADSAPAGGGGGSDSDCRNGSQRYPQFGLVVFFSAPPAPSISADPSATAATTPAAGTTADASTGSAR